MARITVEDCLNHVENRFKLVLLSAKRARQLSKNGALSRVPVENDKATVLALREIAAGYVNFKDEVHDPLELENTTEQPPKGTEA